MRHAARIGRLAIVTALVAVANGGCYRGQARSVSVADVEREPGWLVVRGVP